MRLSLVISTVVLAMIGQQRRAMERQAVKAAQRRNHQPLISPKRHPDRTTENDGGAWVVCFVALLWCRPHRDQPFS